MAIRKLRIKGDDILKKTSKEVKEITNAVITLLDDMKDTMVENQGVGLAAVQVGVLKRIFIIEEDEQVIEFINPVILEQTGEQTSTEGCLSVPNMSGDVTRPTYVKIEAQNRNGEKFVYEANDFYATVLCHENDHLDGQLYIDKATNIEGE